MNPTRTLVMLAVIGTAGSILFAAEPRTSATPAVTETPTATPAPDEAGVAAAPEVAAEPSAPVEDAEDAAPAASTAQSAPDVDPAPPTRARADQTPSPQRFVPSEQVRADFDVSFPVDI